MQYLGQDLETVCQKMAIISFLGHPIFKEDKNI